MGMAQKTGMDRSAGIHAQDLQLRRYGSCPEHRILIRIKILI